MANLRDEMRDQLSQLRKDLEREKSDREALEKEVTYHSFVGQTLKCKAVFKNEVY